MITKEELCQKPILAPSQASDTAKGCSGKEPRKQAKANEFERLVTTGR